MNPYEPQVTIVHKEGHRVVDIHVWRRTRSSEQVLSLLREEDDIDFWFEWKDAPEGVETPPTLTLSEEVYNAIRSSVVGDKLEEREFLRGRLQEMERALTVERNRVDRLLP